MNQPLQQPVQRLFGRMSRAAGSLAVAMTALALVLAFTWHTIALAHADRATALAAQANVDRAKRVAAMLGGITVQRMDQGQFTAMVDALEVELSRAGTNDGVLRGVKVQSMGGLSGINGSLQQGRLELGGATLLQIVLAIETVETSGLPCWIDSLDLSAAGEQVEQWSGSIQVGWVSRAETASIRNR